MHMLCLITYRVRSEKGYGFLRPGLKTGVGNGFFGLKLGLDLEMRAAHPHQKFQRVNPVGLDLSGAIYSQITLLFVLNPSSSQQMGMRQKNKTMNHMTQSHHVDINKPATGTTNNGTQLTKMLYLGY